MNQRYALDVNSWMRASSLRSIRSDYPACLNDGVASALLGVGVGCIAGGATYRLCSLGLEQRGASACGAIIAAVVIVSSPIIYCVNTYSQEKIYYDNEKLLSNYQWHEIVPSSVLYKFVSTCSNEMQSIILRKLNSVQLEGVKEECTLQQHRRGNPRLLSLIEKYDQEAFRVDIPEDEAIAHEKNLLSSLLEQVINDDDFYKDTLNECANIYGDGLQDQILWKLDLIDLFSSDNEIAQKKWISFAEDKNFKKITGEIRKAIFNVNMQKQREEYETVNLS